MISGAVLTDSIKLLDQNLLGIFVNYSINRSSQG